MTYGKEYDTKTQARLLDEETYMREANEARERLHKYFNASDQVLEIGCGLGQNLYYIRQHAQGIDISDYGVKQCQARNIAAKVGDAQKPLSFAPRSFDVVILSNMLEHLKEPSKAMEEAVKVMKDDGLMIVSLGSLEIELQISVKENHELHHHLYSWSVGQFMEFAELFGLKVVSVERRRKRFFFTAKWSPSLYRWLNMLYTEYIRRGYGTSAENIFTLKKVKP